MKRLHQRRIADPIADSIELSNILRTIVKSLNLFTITHKETTIILFDSVLNTSLFIIF